MARVVNSIVFLAVVTCLGCGKSEQVAQNPASNQTPQASDQTVPPPTEVVSQFLDLVRRGGEDSGAGQLLTQSAQATLNKIGRTVQPIGSPDARFTVTRSQPVPDDNGAMLVQSLWSEPTGDGSRVEYEVVWALQRESAGWRISGLAMQQNEAEDPIVIDFENEVLMANLLADPADVEPTTQAPNPSVNPSQAAVPQPGIRQ